MKPDDWIGWSASAILLLTLGREVYVQWRERSTKGVSAWLFVGQVTASVGFVVYSWLVGNIIFVCTNIAILLTALVGQCIFHRNRQLDGRAGRSAKTNGNDPSKTKIWP